MNSTRLFIRVTITLLTWARAAALQSVRCVPPSPCAAAWQRMSRSYSFLSAGTRGLFRNVDELSKSLDSRFQIRKAWGGRA